MKNIMIAWFFCLFATTGFADELAATKSGKQVNLKDDGTWSVVETKAKTIISNSDSPIDVVNAYLSVNDYDDRLNYILDPYRVKSLRDEQNVGRTAWEKPIYKIITKKTPGNLKIGEWAKIETVIQGQNNQWENVIYYLQKTKNGYKIDWESSIGYNKITATEFKLTKPIKPVRIRVLAELVDYYNFEFANASDTMYSILMRDKDGFTYGHGYVSKDSKTGSKIFKALKNGGGHYMVFDIRSLENGRDGSHFLVEDLVSVDSWLIK